jgi:hypothetical protein
VVGIDGNPAAVAFARRTYAAPNLEFREGLVDALDLGALGPNKLAFIEVVEHVYPEQARATLRQFFVRSWGFARRRCARCTGWRRCAGGWRSGVQEIEQRRALPFGALALVAFERP